MTSTISIDARAFKYTLRGNVNRGMKACDQLDRFDEPEACTEHGAIHLQKLVCFNQVVVPDDLLYLRRGD